LDDCVPGAAEQTAIDVDSNENGSDTLLDSTGPDSSEVGSTAVSKTVLEAAKAAIDGYCNSGRADDLELSTILETVLTATQREEVHKYADQQGFRP
jgi:hypothetical protein